MPPRAAPSGPPQPPAAYRQHILGLCKEHGLPAPEFEVRFHPTRAWRFDFGFPALKVAVEVQGGVWRYRTGPAGAHTGKGALRDMEKFNEAACLGWAVLQFTPQDVLAGLFVEPVRRLYYLRTVGRPAD